MVNDTIAGNDVGVVVNGYATWEPIENGPSALVNMIVHQNDTAPISSNFSWTPNASTVLSFEYCDWEGVTGLPTVATAYPWNFDTNPLFVGSGDYHIPVDTPCIDKGNNTPLEPLPARDFEGDLRKLDGDDDDVDTVDLGADEYDPDA